MRLVLVLTVLQGPLSRFEIRFISDTFCRMLTAHWIFRLRGSTPDPYNT